MRNFKDTRGRPPQPGSAWRSGFPFGHHGDGFSGLGRPARARVVYRGLDVSRSVGQQDSPSAKTGTACRASFGHHGAGFSGSGVRPGPFLSTKVSIFPRLLVNRTRYRPKPGPLGERALGTTARVLPGRASGQGPFCLPRSRSFRVCWSTGLAIRQNRDRLSGRLWAPRRGFFRVGRPARALFVYQGLGSSGSSVWPAFCILCRPRLQASPPTPRRWDDDWQLQPTILPRFPNRPPRPRRPRVGGTMIGNYKRPFPHSSRIGRRVPADPVSVGR
jgi:hypothetical protein